MLSQNKMWLIANVADGKNMSDVGWIERVLMCPTVVLIIVQGTEMAAWSRSGEECFNGLFDVVLPAGQVMVWIRVIHPLADLLHGDLCQVCICQQALDGLL